MSDLQCPARVYVAWATGTSPSPAALVPGEQLALVVRPTDPDGLDLDAAADLHRGEAVLVVVDRAPAWLPDLDPGEVARLDVDADGWRRV